eukprot:6485864-Amphidinium_carterae.1
MVGYGPVWQGLFGLLSTLMLRLSGPISAKRPICGMKLHKTVRFAVFKLKLCVTALQDMTNHERIACVIFFCRVCWLRNALGMGCP